MPQDAQRKDAAIRLADSHAHLDDRKFDADREQMIQRAREAGVSRIINVGCDLASSQRSLELAQKYSFIYAAVGLHPDGLADDADGQGLKQIRRLTDEAKVVAIGEIGLDYHWNTFAREIQQMYFQKQLQLATEVQLPVIIHNREAHEDVYRILHSCGLGPAGGVMHCYSGSWEMARDYLDLGMYISFAGPVTFSNARKLVDVARSVPLERLLIETDCPYLAPHPRRGQRNESSYVKLVAEKIAELKGITYAEVAEQTTANACRLFGLQTD